MTYLHPWSGIPRERPRGVGEVPIDALKKAFERSGMTKVELATKMGWMRPNIDRVNRTLGYRPDSNTRGVRRQPRTYVSYAMAVRLCDALGADPVDVGV